MQYPAALAALAAMTAVPLAQTQAKPTPAPPNAAQVLFQQAKLGVQSLPEQQVPYQLMQILRLELPLFPQQAVKDFQALFTQTVNLPASTSFQKQGIETEVIAALAGNNRLDSALSLARTGDVPHHFLYGQILVRAVRDGWSLPKEQALIQECVQSDGTFPYGGALAVLKAAKGNILVQHEILLQAYATAAHETGDVGSSLYILLDQGHAIAPELDSQLSSTLADLITLESQADRPPNPRLMSLYLALLQKTDPDRAQVLKARFPQFAGVPAPPPWYWTVDANGKGQRHLGTPPRVVIHLQPDGTVTLTGGLPGDAELFHNLTRFADSMAGNIPPTVARGLAARADAMLSPDFLNSQNVGGDAATLAEAYQRMGDTAASHALLLRLLDLADAKAQAFETAYEAAPADMNVPHNKYQMIQRMFSPPFSVVTEIYTVAGKLDFPLAVQRVQALPSDAMRPLAEAEVASGWKQPPKQ